MPPVLHMKTGLPLEPGNIEASMRNIGFPSKSMFAGVAVMPFLTIGNKFFLSYMPFGYPIIRISSIASTSLIFSCFRAYINGIALKNILIFSFFNSFRNGTIGAMAISILGLLCPNQIFRNR